MSSLDRRQFTLLPLLAAPLLLNRRRALVHPAAGPQFPPPPRPEQLLLAARVTPEGSEAELLARFERLRAAGFEGLEILWPAAYRAERVRSAAERVGLALHSVRVGEAFGAVLSSNDEDLRARGQKRLADGLQIASALGATSLSLVAGAITPDVSDERAWNRVKIALRPALALARELELRIGLRLGPGDFLGSPLEAARFIDELASPQLGWQLDSGWSLVRSYPQHWIHILGARLVKVDLTDFSREAAASGGLARGFAVALGEGDLHGPTLLEALAHATYSGWVNVDVDESSPETIAAGAQRARALLEL